MVRFGVFCSLFTFFWSVQPGGAEETLKAPLVYSRDLITIQPTDKVKPCVWSRVV